MVWDGVDYCSAEVTVDDAWLRVRWRMESHAIELAAIDRALVRDGFLFISAGGLLIDAFI